MLQKITAFFLKCGSWCVFLPAWQNTTAWAGIVFAVLAVYMAMVPVDLASQAWLAVSIIATLIIVRKAGWIEHVRIFYIFLALFLTLRYFFWRTENTISYHDPASLAAALMLYFAELYGMVVTALGIFVNISPLRRESPPVSMDRTDLPTVDILVPSYNEPPEMLEMTLLAALNVRYPAEKLRVYLCDDGGTVQKRNDPNPEKSAEAWERHHTLVKLCQDLGAHYLTREKNLHAKAGNLNSAMEFTHGELVLILDADHVPTVDILERMVEPFIKDEKMFLVQSMHFFINPDPVEKNLDCFDQMPGENEMFYTVIQRGLDFWNASFFCGSAALLRRKCLVEVGGIMGNSITEDAETALSIHALGYKSAYVHRPMIAGLQPESFTSFIVQRVRWAQGMVQIFILKNPLRIKGLKLEQRLAYMNSSFFWFFPFARVAYLLAPAAFLIFGLKIYDATLNEFMAYALPHLVATMLISDYLYGRVRWAFVSELYELMQSMFAFSGILKVLRNPRAPTFIVTPKGEHLEDDFISRLANPFYFIFFLTIISVVLGVVRYFLQPLDRDVIVVTSSWAVFNLVLLTAAIGALFERRQRRAVPRMPADQACEILWGAHHAAGVITDLSIGGAQIVLPEHVALMSGEKIEVATLITAQNRPITLPAEVRSIRRQADGQWLVGLLFAPENLQQKTDTVLLACGDSERWVNVLRKRAKSVGIFHSLWLLFRLGVKSSGAHVVYLWKSMCFCGHNTFSRMCAFFSKFNRQVRPGYEKE